MSKKNPPATIEFNNLSGAPPWYVKQYEPDPDAAFPLPGFITNDLASPFPKPDVSRPVKKRKLPSIGNLLQLIGGIVIFFWALSFVAGPDVTPLFRSYRHEPSGRYVFAGTNAISTPVPEPIPFTPVPTVYVYATPIPKVYGTPAWYRDDETGAIVYTIATPTVRSSSVVTNEDGSPRGRQLTDRELGMEGVAPVQLR